MLATRTPNDTTRKPACPWCARAFVPGEWWTGANYCRAAFIADLLLEHPGHTTWQLAQLSGMAFDQVSRGLQKARGFHAVLIDWFEDRGDGSVRYQYRAAGDWPTAREQFRITHDAATRRV